MRLEHEFRMTSPNSRVQFSFKNSRYAHFSKIQAFTTARIMTKTPANKNVVKQLPPEQSTDNEELLSQGCGILGHYPVAAVLIFAAVGISCDVGLSFWEPDDPETKDALLKWLGLIGDLFIPALKCVVLPLVFINMVISIREMMAVGKAGSIGDCTS
jgi:hypothetical protein